MSARTESLAVALTAGAPLATVPVAAGGEARLGFRHSIYGSWVEETFRVVPEGLRLRRLRYAEPRLLEFYGHEGARREGEWWVVDGDDALHAALTVRVSAESLMELSVGGVTIRLADLVGAGDAVCVAVVPGGAIPGE